MPQSTQSTPTIAVRFAQFELRPAQRLLLVGGEPVDIGSRAFDLLLAFIERPGELLRKAELMERVWPRVVVEENNLQVQVSTLRRVLGSRAIVTIPGHGYRFTLPLSADDGSSAGAGATVAPPSAVAPGGLALLGGRRSVVLLKLGFANAVTPSTPIADEDWHEFLGAFEGCAKEVLARHGGLLTECDMLGVTALFGLPAAGENDLTQAVEAGLEMITGVRARRWAGSPPGLALRGGLAHASVIAAPGAAPGTWRLSGSLSVTALALCDAAQAHELLVSQETRRQIVPYFDTAPHAPVEHSVLPHALEAHGVLGRSGIVTRIEAARWRGFTPLVGRAEELRVLTMAFNDMLAGKGRAISLVAEAGVGKSRLVAEFGRRLPPEQARVLHARCQPQLQMSAYAPLVDLLRTLLQLKNPAPEWLEADLSQSLQAIDPALKGWTPVVRKLLSAGPMASDAADGLNADVSRRQLSEAVVALISAAARIEPLVLVLDDWHWSDQASDDVLKMLVAMGAHLRVLLIVTARPQAQLAWPTSAHCEQLLLRPLAPAQSADMVRGIFGAQSIATSIASAIHERTEGNPFFIEEICRALLDQGTLTLSDGLLHSKRTIEGIALPHSIEALIRALLDQLPEAAQDLAKLASVLGRDFSRDDLEALSVHAGACGELLARLVDAALIEPTQMVPGPRYRFRHALVQFVAHESLLGRQRQVLHQRVGDMLAERHRECPDEAMDLLAYHYCQGNDAQQAIDCSLRAARLAAQRAAHSVAVQHLNNAIGLLEEQPPGPCRNPQLLDAYAVLGHYLILLQGYRSEGVTRVYERAKALNADDAFGDARFSLAWMLWRYTYVRARLAEGAALAEQLQAMAGRSGNPGKRLAAHAAAGIIALLRGDATRALGCFDVALTNFDAQTELLLAREYGDSPAVFAWTFRGMALTLLGRLDAADGSFQSARELADTLAHPGSRTLALYYSGVFWAALGMLDKVARSSQALVELCERHDFIGIRALGMVQQGMVMLAQGGVHAEKGMAMIQAGADTAIASGSDLFRPVHHLFMAEQLARAGQPDAARAHLLQAREALQGIGPHHNDSELERIQGVLAADQDPAGALRHFERAMALTQARRAPLLGLRCAMDAATLLMSQQRLAAAQGWLQPALEGLSSQAHWPPVARAVALLEKLTNAERPGR